MMCLSSGFHFTALCLRLSYPVSRHFPPSAAAAAATPMLHTRFSFSRGTSSLSVIRATHLQMPHLHYFWRETVSSVFKIVTRGMIMSRMNKQSLYHSAKVAFLKLWVLVLKSIEISGKSRIYATLRSCNENWCNFGWIQIYLTIMISIGL